MRIKVTFRHFKKCRSTDKVARDMCFDIICTLRIAKSKKGNSQVWGSQFYFPLVSEKVGEEKHFSSPHLWKWGGDRPRFPQVPTPISCHSVFQMIKQKCQNSEYFETKQMKTDWELCLAKALSSKYWDILSNRRNVLA